MKRKVIGPINERKKEKVTILVVPLEDPPETTVLIAVYGMNIHQYDFSHFLVPHAPSCLATGRTYPHKPSY